MFLSTCPLFTVEQDGGDAACTGRLCLLLADRVQAVSDSSGGDGGGWSDLQGDQEGTDLMSQLMGEVCKVDEITRASCIDEPSFLWALLRSRQLVCASPFGERLMHCTVLVWVVADVGVGYLRCV